MNTEEFYKLYWRQYQMLESDLLHTDSFVTIDKKNAGTFSAQYVKIFLNVCSEIDSLAEQLRKIIKQKHSECEISLKDFSISKKISAVKYEYEQLDKMSIITKREYDEWKNIPFAKFDEYSSDSWWQDYNHVKHNRNEIIEGSNKYYYEKANLKNSLTALSALYLLCFLTNRLIDDNANDLTSKIFETGYQIFN